MPPAPADASIISQGQGSMGESHTILPDLAPWGWRDSGCSLSPPGGTSVSLLTPVRPSQTLMVAQTQGPLPH